MSDEPTKEVELGSQQALEDMYVTAGGKRYFIHGFHRGFFEQLQTLPATARIELMNLTPAQLTKYTGEKKYAAHQKVLSLLSKKWYWKDTGDKVEFMIDTIPSVSFSLREMQSKMRSTETLEKIIEFFEGIDREVYTKED